ncbi:GH32 C-terminal domain-containing protein [Luteococcus sp. Sow4_B9]|uniref:glycoside hydrolase family 32 protein n=1 Tax=Luteococcus sp. Sow4_B9 TaxID=3438792 RepID=UPI003F95FEFA
MTDLTLPIHHVRPPRGWVNDPNGLVHHDGRWHVFFQYNPDSHRHHRIRWGHASSEDLLHWRQEPDALVPCDGAVNDAGSWSGTITIDADGTPVACYTAVRTDPRQAVGAIARGSRDLREWEVVEQPAAARLGVELAETRDPYVVQIDGHRYIIQGHGGPGVPARVLVYDAEDLSQWRLLGDLCTVDDPVAAAGAAADIWECPQLVQVDGHWVLVLSLWRHDGVQGQLSGVRWLVGDVDLRDGCPHFTARTAGVLDDGPAFYAPQVVTHDGRTLLFGWSWELDCPDEVLAERGWAGVITSPRELRVRDGRVLQEIPTELVAPAGEVLATTWRQAEHRHVVLTAQEAGRLTCTGGRGRTPVELASGAVVLIDGSLVEVFVDGRTHTTRVYPGEESVWEFSGAATVRAFCSH